MTALARLLSYVFGVLNRDLLLKNEFQAETIRALRSEIKGRIRLSDEQRQSLAELGKRMGRRLLSEVESIVTPDTVLRWYRELVARKFDGSKKRQTPGRPRTKAEVEGLVLKLARENRSWGYHRISGALHNLGHEISHQTVGDVLKRNGVEPAPTRNRGMRWSEFLKTHLASLAAMDFFSVEVLGLRGLVTYYVLFVIDLASRRVHLAGLTHSPDETWVKTVAMQLTVPDQGFLNGKRFLIHDRDSKFTAAFDRILKDAGTKPLLLPAHSPNLNAFAERWIRSIKSECLRNVIFFGMSPLLHAIEEYLRHYHAERNHQGLANRVIQPRAEDRVGEPFGQIQCRERLGGLLKFYCRAA